ncbi:MAG TPA: phage tail sheath subtilisin-like domain-containing protein [Candidatus Limnocylindrales bacterium]
MPIAPTYPGVYIEELPSGVRTIIGVSTSVTAFLGSFTKGKLNTPIQVFSLADLDRNFGPLVTSSEVGYAIRQFFLNGGREAWVVRVASGTPAAAAIAMLDAVTAGNAALLAEAASEGVWGNRVQIDVDHETSMAGQFNLTAREVDASGRTVASESYRNLGLVSSAPNFAPAVVNSSSSLIRLTNLATSPTARVAETGTMTSTALTDAAANGLAATKTLQVVVNGTNVGGTFTLGATRHETASRLASLLQALIQSVDSSLRNVRVTAEPSTATTRNLRVTGGANGSDLITFGGTLAPDIKLDVVNVQAYSLGGTASAAQAVPPGPPAGQRQGNDGGAPNGAALLGDAVGRTGIYALDTVDIFNILCVPDTMNLVDNEAAAFIPLAETYCESRRAFFILDVPQQAATRDTVQEIKDWLDGNAGFRHKNAALYFPRPNIPDPVNGFRDRLVPSSGTVAGLYARTDAERGVWKAPAGTEAVLRGVRSLETTLTDDQNGTLNPLGINNLRTFPVYGTVCWGARTLDGADRLASEWKYIPIRRTALFIEESLFRGTKWAVFEPNDEPLWARLRLNVGSFMHSLFRQGAFAGTTPKEAYFVKCDGDTTTQTDRNLGVVNILVGFAPLKPAEFVIIQIQQIAGKIET